MTVQNPRGTPSWLGAVNDRLTLAALLDHGPLTRNRICEIVGVSKPTASAIAQRLLSGGFIVEHGLVTGNAGPSAVVYAARADRPLGVAIDLDARELRASVVDAAGTDAPVVTMPLSADPAERDAVAEVTAALERASAAAGADPDAVVAISIGFAGYVDPAEQELFSEVLPGWPRFRLPRLLGEALGRTIRIENDVSLAALAERTTGAGIDADVFALLWLGNGVGAAFDLGGELHRGSFGGAGEIGFLEPSVSASTLDPEARSLQDLVGGGGVVSLARRHGLAADDYPSAIAAIAASPGRAPILAEYADRVAAAVLPLLAVLDPRLVVLGGPTAAVGGAELAAHVAAGIRRISRWYPEVETTAVGADAVHRGARVLTVQAVRSALLDSVARLAAH